MVVLVAGKKLALLDGLCWRWRYENIESLKLFDIKAAI